jgi:hypothetical protein
MIKNKVLKVQSRCAHVAQNGEKWDLLKQDINYLGKAATMAIRRIGEDYSSRTTGNDALRIGRNTLHNMMSVSTNF